MSEPPFALHITWTCYANWLPGDRRGYVSNTPLPQGGYVKKQNIPGTPYTKDDAHARECAHAAQRHPRVQLTAKQALCAAQAMVEAAKTRGWSIVRAALMATHVHAVVMNCPADGPAVRRVLKGTSATALRKRFPDTRRWWTAGGSDRYKNDWPSIEAAVHYVANQDSILVAIINMEVSLVTRYEL